jgi:hypothetical protein
MRAKALLLPAGDGRIAAVRKSDSSVSVRSEHIGAQTLQRHDASLPFPAVTLLVENLGSLERPWSQPTPRGPTSTYLTLLAFIFHHAPLFSNLRPLPFRRSCVKTRLTFSYSRSKKRETTHVFLLPVSCSSGIVGAGCLSPMTFETSSFIRATSSPSRAVRKLRQILLIGLTMLTIFVAAGISITIGCLGKGLT